MKGKSWLKYLIYIILIIVLLLIKELFMKKLEENYLRFYNINYFLFIIVAINLIVGIILGLDHFIDEWKKDGTWMIHLPKLILMGVPTLLFSTILLFRYLENQMLKDIYTFFISYGGVKNLNVGIHFDTVLQIILGYVIITSFCKHRRKI
ncbi:MAG: hypothetical protein K0S41_2368 [Anaerocolumna sp.]|jgi:hypothetical protein|nr:hypothetical protein [Anaerocolumna sp.]